MIQICRIPDRFDIKTIWLPSGDQLGCRSQAPQSSRVNWIAGHTSRSTTQISSLSLSFRDESYLFGCGQPCRIPGTIQIALDKARVVIVGKSRIITKKGQLFHRSIRKKLIKNIGLITTILILLSAHKCSKLSSR